MILLLSLMEGGVLGLEWKRRFRCDGGRAPAVGGRDALSPGQTSCGIAEVALRLFSAPSSFCFPLICVAARRLLAAPPPRPPFTLLNEPRNLHKDKLLEARGQSGRPARRRLLSQLATFQLSGGLVGRLYVIFPITWGAGRLARWSHFSRRLGRLIINTLPRG